MKKIMAAILAVVVLSFVIGLVVYPSMPDRMASHWNTRGEVDGWMPRFWGVFIMPIISVVILGLFLALPAIDPMKNNIKKFRKYFDGFIFVIMLFLVYIYILTLVWNAGYMFGMGRMIVPAIAAILWFAGVLNENAKRNWFIGIRTPWTLSSDVVWKKTHKLGGKLFKLSAVIAVFAFFLEDYAVWLMLAPIIASVIWLFIYSYLEYQKIKKK